MRAMLSTVGPRSVCLTLFHLAHTMPHISALWLPAFPRLPESPKGIESMATLRKSDITSRVSTKLGGSLAQGEDALNAVLDSIQDALAAGDRVVLTGFGSFEVRKVKARRVKPIRGGDLVTVPAHKRVGFTPGVELNGAVKD